MWQLLLWLIVTSMSKRGTSWESMDVPPCRIPSNTWSCQKQPPIIGYRDATGKFRAVHDLVRVISTAHEPFLFGIWLDGQVIHSDPWLLIQQISTKNITKPRTTKWIKVKAGKSNKNKYNKIIPTKNLQEWVQAGVLKGHNKAAFLIRP